MLKNEEFQKYQPPEDYVGTQKTNEYALKQIAIPKQILKVYVDMATNEKYITTEAAFSLGLISYDKFNSYANGYFQIMDSLLEKLAEKYEIELEYVDWSKGVDHNIFKIHNDIDKLEKIKNELLKEEIKRELLNEKELKGQKRNK